MKNTVNAFCVEMMWLDSTQLIMVVAGPTFPISSYSGVTYFPAGRTIGEHVTRYPTSEKDPLVTSQTGSL